MARIALTSSFLFSGEYTKAKSGTAKASCECEDPTERDADGNTGARSVLVEIGFLFTFFGC